MDKGNKKGIRRSIDFPDEVYKRLKDIAVSEEISINSVVIRELRRSLNIPVKKEDELN